MISFWWNNLASLNATTVTASSYSTGFPPTNIQNNQPTIQWLTGATLTTEWILMDLGSAMSITDFICAFHNLTSSDSSIELQYGSSGTTTTTGLSSPTGTISLTWNALAIQQSFTAKNYRYWCFVFTKSSSSLMKQIGGIFLGTQSTVNPPDLPAGAQVIRQDLSIVNTSKSGQDYGLQKPMKRSFDLTWTNAFDSDFRTIDTIWATAGKTLKFWMQIDPQGLTGDTDLMAIVYVRFSADPSNVESDAHDAEECWDLEYVFLEQI